MTKPTDAEIGALVDQFRWDTAEGRLQLIRAVLAKWGTPPAVAGEPVAWLDPWSSTKVTTDYDAYGKHGIPLYTAPQPFPTAQADSQPEPASSDTLYLLRRLLSNQHTLTSAEFREELTKIVGEAAMRQTAS